MKVKGKYNLGLSNFADTFHMLDEKGENFHKLIQVQKSQDRWSKTGVKVYETFEENEILFYLTIGIKHFLTGYQEAIEEQKNKLGGFFSRWMLKRRLRNELFKKGIQVKSLSDIQFGLPQNMQIQPIPAEKIKTKKKEAEEVPNYLG